jgi:hypothetical protein
MILFQAAVSKEGDHLINNPREITKTYIMTRCCLRDDLYIGGVTMFGDIHFCHPIVCKQTIRFKSFARPTGPKRTLP